MWFVLLMVACTDDVPEGMNDGTESVSDGTDPDATGIEIAGSWVDNYGFNHVITDDSWESYDSDAPVSLSAFDNAEGWAVGQNHVDDFFPSQWSRFDWVQEADGQRWYCQTAFDEDTEDAALSANPADAADVATTGCGGSPWSQLNAAR